MSSKLKQLEISFDPFQDRLILKFHTDDLKEFRIWLTRRFTKLLWSALQKILEFDEKPAEEQKEEEEKITNAYEQEKAMKESSFVSKYSTGKVNLETTPLGAEPILVSKIHIKTPPHQAPVLCLIPEKGQGFELSAPSVIARAISKLIIEVLPKADWDLEFTEIS